MGTIQNPRQKLQLIHGSLCFQNPPIRSIYQKNPQSVRFLKPIRRSENLFTPLRELAFAQTFPFLFPPTMFPKLLFCITSHVYTTPSWLQSELRV